MSASSGSLLFSNVKIRQGINGNGYFQVVEDGYYYISLSFCNEQNATVILRKNGIDVPEMKVDLIEYGCLMNDMSSKSIMLQMNVRDTFEFRVTNGLIYSSDPPIISLSVASLDFSTQIVTVVKTSEHIFADFEKFTFDNILNNMGNSWQSEDNTFNCKESGIYKISISIGIRKNFPLTAEIIVNDDIKGRLYSQRTSDQRTRFISRSLLINLNQNDKLYIRAKGVTDATVTKSVMNIFKL